MPVEAGSHRGRHGRPQIKKRTSMLEKFAIALVAAGLIAAPALAQAPATQTAPAAKSVTAPQAQPRTGEAADAKQVKRVRHATRHHRGKHIAKVHVKRHAKRIVHHRHARHYVKPAIKKAG